VIGHRLERLAEEIREEASVIVPALKDPRIGFVTITRVTVTSDLGLATVFVGVLGSEAERKKTLDGLRAASGYVRRELGRRLTIRRTPEIQFEYDKGLEATERVARLLDGLKADGEPRS